MISKIYVVYDRVAEESGPVFEAKNDGVAIRQYLHLIKTKNMVPADFNLLHVGEIDHDVSVITANPAPIEVILNVSKGNINE